jgi:hypothetical protein
MPIDAKQHPLRGPRPCGKVPAMMEPLGRELGDLNGI